MIKAYGRALVATSTNSGPSFTVPIIVAPQSLEQIYTMVQNGKSDLAREWIFRSLDFVGALAAVMAPASHAGRRLVEDVAISTGTVIPSLKTLWVDKVPNNLLNIVNFGMPNLIKVPKGGSIDEKYLFFSQGKLQAILQDPLMKFSGEELRGGKISSDFSVPVVSISFDTLQIPFENTTSSTETDTANKAADLKNRAGALISKLKDLQSNWKSTSGAIAGLTAADYNASVALVKKFSRLDATNFPAGFTNVTVLQANLGTCAAALAWLAPNQINDNLVAARDIGLSQLADVINQLQIVQQGLLQDKPATLYDGTLADAQKQITLGETRYNYLQAVADATQANQIPAALGKAWKEDPKQMNAEDLNSLLSALSADIAKLPKSPFGQ